MTAKLPVIGPAEAKLIGELEPTTVESLVPWAKTTPWAVHEGRALSRDRTQVGRFTHKTGFGPMGQTVAAIHPNVDYILREMFSVENGYDPPWPGPNGKYLYAFLATEQGKVYDLRETVK